MMFKPELYKQQGFREASMAQLKIIDYLLENRELTRADLEHIDRWIEGMASFNPEYIIGWMKDRPTKKHAKLP